MNKHRLIILILSILIGTLIYLSTIPQPQPYPYYIDTADDLLDKTLNHA